MVSMAGTAQVEAAITVGRVARLKGPAAVAAAAAAVTAVAAVHDPYRAGAYPGCPLYLLTGLYCPLCGSTRALHDLAHLDLASAWGMNPLFVLSVPILVVLWMRWTGRSWALRPARPRGAGLSRTEIVVGIVMLVFGVLRNIPFFAPWLAP
jgi:hypothetical protein